MTTYIKGSISRIIYENLSTGYKVGVVKIKENNIEELDINHNKTITFTGYFHELNDVNTYIMYGSIVNHEKYGVQFQVESYDRCRPEEKDSIIEFLTSGLFKGIGEKKATQIVNMFKDKTLKIILHNPEDLLIVPNLTKKNIDTLHNKLKEYEESYETIMFLSDIGFNTKDSMIIYNTYKHKTREIITTNIYQVTEDILNLSFKKVDLIALKNGVEKDDQNRIKAAIIYIMNEVSNTYGHCYYSYDEIMRYLNRVLGIFIDEEKYDQSLISLIQDTHIIEKEGRYYLKQMYEAETLIVKRFRRLNSNKPKANSKIDDVIKDLEDKLNIHYNKEQLEAVKKSITNDFLIITGGPGTGKTTIMKAIVEVYRMTNNLSYSALADTVALLAPTGRAAKRMSEATLTTASTIHRFLKWSKETDRFQINEYNKSKVKFVIIDEASMIDTYLMASLIKGLSSSCKIVIVGDDHQLSSIGPGQVLHDLIDSDMLKTVQLKELYRQSNDSNIISLAYDIRNQEIDESIFNVDEDLTFIKCSPSEVIDNICEISNTYKDISYKQFQILAPMYKGINGIDTINNQVRDIFNPKADSKKEYRHSEVLLREEDKVIQLTNQPEDNVYNGDIGLIDRIDTSKKEIKIDFDSNLVRYTPANYVNFRMAYAISIHKAQGSEFDIVILPIVKGYNKMLYQRLIYTAVTRAKKKLYIIGEIDALRLAINTTDIDTRRTTIKEYLINGIV